VAALGSTNGRLLGRVLRAAGVDAVYGRPWPGLDVVGVVAAPVAALMADAHLRVHGRPAALHRGDGVLVVGGGALAPGDGTVTVTSVADLLDAVQPLQAATRWSAGLELIVGLDPEAPAPDVVPIPPPPVDRWVEPDDELVATLASASRPIVLAGPGVVRDGAVPGLHAVAAAANLGVLNTWGAKGVFDWRSRHHLATAGLQSDDFTLGGLADADLIVATGVDPAEAPDERWRLAPVAEVVPGALDPLAGRWSRPLADIAVPPLRAGLARVTQDGWASTAAPLAPSLVTRHYAQVVGAAGMVTADPGIAGYWVARTFATTELGGAQVPSAAAARGFAVACATVARLRSPHRPVLAAVDSPMADVVLEALAAAARLGVAVPLEVWGADAERLDAADHLARLQALVHADAPGPVGLATDATQMARMIEVAGEVIAWTA
jgi:thiamine pyrophosphate-dependent acetolactate synthase large subunit-like protein